MDAKQMVAEFKLVNDEFQKTRERLGKQLGGILSNAVKDFGHDLVAIKWRQYTPYFMDGDACTFSVNDLYFKFKDTDEDDGDYSDGFIGAYELTDNDKEDPRIKLVEELSEMFYSIDDDIFEMAFDDHTTVTILADGTIETDECDHD